MTLRQLQVGGGAVTTSALSVPTAGGAATMGRVALNGTTEVTVSTTAVTANSNIFITANVIGGTPLGVAYVSSRNAGTSFGIKGAATDTSTVAWLLVEPA
jgi:hypothetical protein